MKIGNYFIDSLPAEVRKKLAFQLQTVRLAKRSRLACEGEEADTVYFPITAVISKYQTTKEGQTMEVAIAGKEGAAGLTSAYGSGESISSSEVLLGGWAAKIRSEYFRKIGEKDAALRTQVISLIDVETKRKTRRLICNRYHTVEQRLCTWLLMLHDRRGSTKFRITQAEIARALGIHRPTVTLATHLLRNQQLINQATGIINVLDIGGIETMACECRDVLRIGQETKIAAKNTFAV